MTVISGSSSTDGDESAGHGAAITSEGSLFGVVVGRISFPSRNPVVFSTLEGSHAVVSAEAQKAGPSVRAVADASTLPTYMRMRLGGGSGIAHPYR